MRINQQNVFLKLFCLSAVFFIIASAAPRSSAAQDAETVSLRMAPHMIVLNAQGQSESFQGLLPMSLEAGYSLDEYEVLLSLDGIAVAWAYDFRYCYIDDIFLASFDRTGVLEHPVTAELAGGVVTATVSGWYTATSSDGDSLIRYFTGSDDVEIVAPKRK
jgi:hypothetical protein